MSGFAGSSAGDAVSSDNTSMAASKEIHQTSQNRDAVLSSIGDPQASHMAYGHQLMTTLPPAIIEALHETYLARAVVCAVLRPRTISSRQTISAHATANGFCAMEKF